MGRPAGLVRECETHLRKFGPWAGSGHGSTKQEMGLAEKICKTQSDRFSGVCLSDNNCAIICRQFEKFESGHCEFEGVFRRCLCTKAC
ncbi:PREDICTED: defensin-like protein 8 [Camelina sativa]|uniref:Defensin-like protein 8 n=1 Tax=Camelina sativa TaxID=90675 RepID=A0ABM1R6E3_CAMSA|nr:PREDICTED: defensin-like protein 8 [Camelina sativa]